MQRLLLYKGRKFNIGGFILSMEYANRLCYFAGEDVWNAFEEKSDKTSDFSFYIHSEEPPEEFTIMNSPVHYEKDIILLNYSPIPAFLCLKTDVANNSIHLYHNDRSSPNNWFEHLGHVFSWLSLKHNACNMHAVILEYQGKGILLTAPSGTGKSTHAHYWRDVENALIINGDRALLRLIDGEWWACGSPWSGTSGECVNRKVTLSAIVVLEQGQENCGRKLSAIEGMSKILPRMIAPRMIPELGEKGVDYAINLAESIPIFEYACKNHPDSVTELKKLLLKSGVLE